MNCGEDAEIRIKIKIRIRNPAALLNNGMAGNLLYKLAEDE
jgi:hypothetical protein